MSVPFQPTADFVLIQPLPRGQTAGGIALPDGADPDPMKGRVIAVGPGRISEYGVLIPNGVKPGDLVYCSFACQQAGQMTLGGVPYLMVRQRDVLGTIPKNQAAENDECTQACCARPEPALAA